MGAKYTHKCNKCGYSVSTSGPWEFYRDSEGNRKFFGHPSPNSEEARQSGIQGLFGNLYCPKCDKVFDLVLDEYKKPTFNKIDMWLGRCESTYKYNQEDADKCPICGNTDLILKPLENEEIVCPRCGKGKLVGKMDWGS